MKKANAQYLAQRLETLRINRLSTDARLMCKLEEEIENYSDDELQRLFELSHPSSSSWRLGEEIARRKK